MTLLDQFHRRVESEQSQKARHPDLGANLPNSVADVSALPPSDWETQLRVVNPKTTLHSWLQFYYYRVKDRWVLYDCLPVELIEPDRLIQPGLMGRELLAALRGPAPRDRPASERTAFVSDMQHEMHRLHRVYAVPFWVLQGESGGHQVAFSAQQRDFLTQTNRPIHPPAIGSLPGCTFDGRVIGQLQRMNRLAALGNDLEKLRASGSGEAASVQQALREREIREVSLQVLEQQLGAVAEMVHDLGGRKDTQDQVIHRPGDAARASEALAAYIETGTFIM